MGTPARKLDKKLDGYWGLIKKFPLCPITNGLQHRKAIKVAKVLAIKADKRSADETDYYIALCKLICDYEYCLPSVQKFLKKARQASPVEVLKYLMEENKLSQTRLAAEVDLDQGNLSAFLAGRRKLSSAAALKLAKRFVLSSDFFLR